MSGRAALRRGAPRRAPRWAPAPAGNFSPHAGALNHGNGISAPATHPPLHADAPSLPAARRGASPSLPLSPRGNEWAAFSRSAHVEVRPAGAPPTCGPPSCACPSYVALSCSASLAEVVGSHPSFPWPRSHTTPSCAAPSSGSRGGISSSVLSPSSSRPVSFTSCAPTLGAWGACLAEALPICHGSNGGE